MLIMGTQECSNLIFDLKDPRVQLLAESDDKLGKLIRYIGTCELALEKDGFSCLIKYIIGQQISDKARETIWKRMDMSFCGIDPSKAINVEEDELRKIGLSWRKIEYIKTLAKAILDNSISFDDFKTCSNEEVITKLTQIKGIGRWTAEMYLVFSLGRIDVLSVNDGTIKRSLKWMYDLEALPTASEVKKYFEKWIDYSSIVSAYFWKSILLGLQQKSFGEAILC